MWGEWPSEQVQTVLGYAPFPHSPIRKTGNRAGFPQGSPDWGQRDRQGQRTPGKGAGLLSLSASGTGVNDPEVSSVLARLLCARPQLCPPEGAPCSLEQDGGQAACAQPGSPQCPQAVSCPQHLRVPVS